MLAATWPTSSLSMPWTSMRVGWGTTNSMPSGASTTTGWLKPSERSSFFGALGAGPVADADDVELLAEAVGHADDHVVDERADEAVQRPVLTLVVGALDEQLAVGLADGDRAGDPGWSWPLGPLTVTCGRRS